MGTDDRELVTRFLRGEKEAIETVDGWISRAAWPYRRRLADQWDDVLQEIRLEVTRLLGQGKFRGESSLRTYLWRVVSHTCLDKIQAQSKRKWTSLDGLDLLLRVLDRMPQDCRELWRMIVAGFSYREMSLRLNIAEGTLRVRVLRCRERALAVRRELLDGPPGGGRNNPTKDSPTRSGKANMK
jgi:RNA polymerase sigma factor (sigma-70 family)